MSVRFNRNGLDSYFGNDPRVRDTLHGQPFPNDEVQALWHMWPSNLTLSWNRGFGYFVLQYDGGKYRWNISSEEANNYDYWLALLQRIETNHVIRR
jgi:hypothetical protein